MALIYKIENKENHKVYIGQTYYDLEWRLTNSFCGHFKRAFEEKATQSKLYTALRKYGKDGFTHEVVEEMKNSDTASYLEIKAWLNEREQYWIERYDAINSGYNMIKGNKGYSGWSEEARKRWSIKMKEQANRPEVKEKTRASVLAAYATGEPQKKISESVKRAHREHPEILDKISLRSKNSVAMFKVVDGQEHIIRPRKLEVEDKLKDGWNLGLPPKTYGAFRYHQLGKQRTEEERAKISAALAGKKKTAEHAKHISEGLKGRTFTEETKKNISDATKKAMARQEVKEKVSAGLRNRVWINNGEISKTVKDYELDSYLAKGFVRGKLPCNRCWVNNGIIGKQVKAAELETYLANGFVKGMLKK